MHACYSSDLPRFDLQLAHTLRDKQKTMNATHSSTSSGGSGIGTGPVGYGGMPTCYFVMIGTKDNPIYEAEFVSVNTARSTLGGATIPEAKVQG